MSCVIRLSADVPTSIEASTDVATLAFVVVAVTSEIDDDVDVTTTVEANVDVATEIVAVAIAPLGTTPCTASTLYEVSYA